MIKYILEIIGTVAFAVSGATVGIRKKMDILGVMTMGVFTAVGGEIPLAFAESKVRDDKLGQIRFGNISPDHPEENNELQNRSLHIRSKR